MKEEFLRHGFVKQDRLIPFSEVEKLRLVYDQILSDRTLTKGLRSDLGGGAFGAMVERITQVMCPSRIKPELLTSNTYQLVIRKVRGLLGEDMALDFDMLINKAPNTDTITPWHQDAAYWIKMPDKRAVSCWIALDDVYEENGCMWFIPKADDSVKPHSHYTEGGALYCETDVSKAVSVPLKPGGCTFHDGFTLHFSKGNITNSHRRALILNFRPEKMIEFERRQGVDHTGAREVRNK